MIRFLGEDDVTPIANNVTNSIENVGTVTKTVGNGFGALQSIATGAFQAIGGAAVNLAGAAIGKLGSFISGSIAEAAEFQSVLAQTNAVLKSTGEAAGFSAGAMVNMAESLSASAGQSMFSDDAILSAQNVLATFTQIKGVNFADATLAITNISQALGTDLQSSALQVGKALNDPVAGIGALTRVGVSFTEAQKAQVQALIDVGDVAGAQAIILGELETQFGGSALAAMDTFAGKQAMLSEQFAGIQQTLGEALLPVLIRFTSYFAEYLVPVINAAVVSFADFISGIDWAGIVSAIDSVYASSIDFISGIDWSGSLAAIQSGFFALVAVFDPITLAIRNLVDVAMPAIMSLHNALTNQLASPQTTGYLTNLATVFALLGDIIISVLGHAINGLSIQIAQLQLAFEFLWPYIQIVINGISAIIAPFQLLVIGVLTAISQALKGDTANAFETLKTAVNTFTITVSTAISGLVTTVTAKLQELIGTLSAQAMAIGTSIANGISKGISDGAIAIANAARRAAQGALDAAMKLLGIASPSKAFANLVGRPISQGMAAGIMAGIPDVTNAMSATLGSGVNAAQATVQNYYQLSATYNTQQSESSIMADFQAMQLLAGGI